MHCPARHHDRTTHARRSRCAGVLLAGVAIVAACSAPPAADDARVTAGPDGAAPDALTRPDGSVADAPTPDVAATPDAARDAAPDARDVASPPPDGGAARTIKLLTWNTGGPLSAAAVSLVADQTPQVVFLQEVDSPALVTDLRTELERRQGGTWQQAVVTRGTDTSSSYVAIVARFTLVNVASVVLRRPGTYVMSCYSSSAATFAGRAAVGASLSVAGRTLSVISVRLTSEGDRGCVREDEVRTLKAWADTTYRAAPHVYAGDFNMQPEAAEREYQLMLGDPHPTADSWALAVAAGTAVSFDGRPSISTPTRNTRLDYIFFDRGAPGLAVRSAEILDEGALSDHRMMITTFNVD